MPQTLTSHAHTGDFAPSQVELLRQGISALRLFISNPEVLNAAPTNVLATLNGTTAQHANSVIFPNGAGAPFLLLQHQWAGTLATAPALRVFGRLPEARPRQADLAPQGVDRTFQNTLWDPVAAGANVAKILQEGGAWIPLSDNATTPSYTPAIGSTTVFMINGTTNFSSPVLIRTLGCTHLIGLVSTAAGGMTASTSKIFGALCW